MDDELLYRLETAVAERLRSLTKSLCILAVLRLLLFDFLWMLSDLCSALIVYFAYTNRTSLMAIFSLVNGSIGLIYAIMKGVNDMYFMANYVQSTLFKFYLIFMFIFSVIVYSLVIINSYIAYKVFPSAWEHEQRYRQVNQNPNQGGQGVAAIYVVRQDGQVQRANFVPFGGRGQQVGTNVNNNR